MDGCDFCLDVGRRPYVAEGHPSKGGRREPSVRGQGDMQVMTPLLTRNSKQLTCAPGAFFFALLRGDFFLMLSRSSSSCVRREKRKCL
jgi:hypothetical protein